MGAVSRVGRLLPATKGEVQDVNAEVKEYKIETTVVIDALVSAINSLTPVGSLFWHMYRCDIGHIQAMKHLVLCRDTMAPTAWTASMERVVRTCVHLALGTMRDAPLTYMRCRSLWPSSQKVHGSIMCAC